MGEREQHTIEVGSWSVMVEYRRVSEDAVMVYCRDRALGYVYVDRGGYAASPMPDVSMLGERLFPTRHGAVCYLLDCGSVEPDAVG